MKRTFLVTLAIIGFILLLVVLKTCSYLNEVDNVVSEEIAPKRLLEKYEWFKDSASVLDKKRADLQVYSQRRKNLQDQYQGAPRTEWAREDRSQVSIWSSEEAGIAASYNQLAAEYNSQMSKINWAFTNVGSLPKGTTETLPREFKPYITE